MGEIVPIHEIKRRPRTAGRIRIGKKVPSKSGKMRPIGISQFRFTSDDKAAIEQIAALYGGTPKPWKEPKASPGQWEVETEATEIRVALPPDPLGDTPIFEKWESSSNARRCDGVEAEVTVDGPDGPERRTVPCVCIQRGWTTKSPDGCRYKTRLSVLLPEVRFLGVWRLDTGSEAAAHELPGMVEAIQTLQGKGIQRAVLRVEERVSWNGREKKEYRVPVLGVDETVEALAAGSARLGALPSAPADPPLPELEAGTPDDEVIEAELVDDDWLEDLSAKDRARVLRMARTVAEEMGEDLPTKVEEITEAVADRLREMEAAT